MIEICGNMAEMTRRGIQNYVKLGKLIPNRPTQIDPITFFGWSGTEKELIDRLKNEPLLIVTTLEPEKMPQNDQNINIAEPEIEVSVIGKTGRGRPKKG